MAFSALLRSPTPAIAGSDDCLASNSVARYPEPFKPPCSGSSLSSPDTAWSLSRPKRFCSSSSSSSSGRNRHLFLTALVPARVRSQRLARVRSGESECGSPIIEDLTHDEHDLHQELEAAVKKEDYVQAAKIRDRLRVLHEDSKAAVLAANSRFYHAFRNGNLAAMQAIWARGDHAYVVHPKAGRINGYDLVMGSWEIVCGADHEFPLVIDLKDVEVHVRGDVGYVSCMEVVKSRGNSWGKQVATNVFERVEGKWFICVHHASHIDG